MDSDKMTQETGYPVTPDNIFIHSFARGARESVERLPGYEQVGYKYRDFNGDNIATLIAVNLNNFLTLEGKEYYERAYIDAEAKGLLQGKKGVYTTNNGVSIIIEKDGIYAIFQGVQNPLPSQRNNWEELVSQDIIAIKNQYAFLSMPLNTNAPVISLIGRSVASGLFGHSI